MSKPTTSNGSASVVVPGTPSGGGAGGGSGGGGGGEIHGAAVICEAACISLETRRRQAREYQSVTLLPEPSVKAVFVTFDAIDLRWSKYDVNDPPVLSTAVYEGREPLRFVFKIGGADDVVTEHIEYVYVLQPHTLPYVVPDYIDFVVGRSTLLRALGGLEAEIVVEPHQGFSESASQAGGGEVSRKRSSEPAPAAQRKRAAGGVNDEACERQIIRVLAPAVMTGGIDPQLYNNPQDQVLAPVRCIAVSELDCNYVSKQWFNTVHPLGGLAARRVAMGDQPARFTFVFHTPSGELHPFSAICRVDVSGQLIRDAATEVVFGCSVQVPFLIEVREAGGMSFAEVVRSTGAPGSPARQGGRIPAPKEEGLETEAAVLLRAVDQARSKATVAVAQPYISGRWRDHPDLACFADDMQPDDRVQYLQGLDIAQDFQGGSIPMVVAGYVSDVPETQLMSAKDIDRATAVTGAGRPEHTRLFLTRCILKVRPGPLPTYLSAAEGSLALRMMKRSLEKGSKAEQQFDTDDSRGLFVVGSAGDWNCFGTAYLTKNNDPQYIQSLAYEARSLKQTAQQSIEQYLTLLEIKLQSVPDAVKTAQVAPGLLENLLPSTLRTMAAAYVAERRVNNNLTFVGLCKHLRNLAPSLPKEVAAVTTPVAEVAVPGGGRRDRWHNKQVAGVAAVVATPSGPPAGGAFRGVCHQCQKEGHRKTECPDMECRVCKQKGHLAAACPGAGCFVCGKTGHLAPACKIRKCLCGTPPLGHTVADCPGK